MLITLKKFTSLFLTLTIIISLTFTSAAGKNRDASNQENSDINNASRCCSVSDAAYGNFRNVKAGKIGSYNLFRSQHPANGSFRSFYANKLAKANAIKTVLNLSDSDKKLNAYFEKYKIAPTYYYRTLYANGNIYTADMSCLYKAASYQKKTVECMRFISRRKGPYLIHCEVGRDRTAFVTLVIECLMGATYTYMLNDDTKTYINQQGLTYAEARKKSVQRLNAIFHYFTGKSKNTNWGKLNLSYYAELYLKKGGMTPAEITALKRNLSIDYPEGGTWYKLKNVPAKWSDSGAAPSEAAAFDQAAGQAAKDGATEE